MLAWCKSNHLWGPLNQYGGGQVTDCHRFRSVHQVLRNPVLHRYVQHQVFKLDIEFDYTRLSHSCDLVCFGRVIASLADLLKNYALLCQYGFWLAAPSNS